MDAVLDDPRLRAAAERLGPRLVRRAAEAALADCRAGRIDPADVADHACAGLPETATTMRRVVNATGVVVHTNLGRAPLSDAAVQAIRIAAGATDVELDLATGKRGARGWAASEALRAATGAEAAHVVNNGAAAVALAVATFAHGRAVVVARGELVEIGDGFRLPELLEAAGVRLLEVGTTNRVRPDDYAAAARQPDAAAILKVHPSNFRVTGFTSSVDVAELAPIGLPVLVDIGSGLLAPHPRLPDEPDATTTIGAGAAVVTASGDKLLGGPQCGLILGQADAVAAMRRYPMARAYRVDKVTLAALEATLIGPLPPVGAALEATPAQLTRRAERLAAALPTVLRAQVVRCDAVVGGGGAPGVLLPSAAVAVPGDLAARLRAGDPAVVGRLDSGRLLLDVIAVRDDDIPELATAVSAAAGAGAGAGAGAEPR